MIDETQERRDGHLPRVSLEALVDVCAGDQAAEAFQGQSVDVSQRGMQLKSPFLPHVGVPLVLRFRDERGEVLAEGEVVWRTPGQRGGEFGVRFTAVDSQSVGTLQSLCCKGAGHSKPRASRCAPLQEPEADVARQLDTEEPMSLSEGEDEQDTEPTPPVEMCPEPEPPARSSPPGMEPLRAGPAGALHDTPLHGRPQEAPAAAASEAVRLHIDGLGKPLSGRGQPEGSGGLCVASSLEFLKLGKPLWVESGISHERRQATIRGVDVRVTEPSEVPELVVRLGYDESRSAEPAVRAPLPSPRVHSLSPEPPASTLSPLQAVSQAFDEKEPSEPRSSRWTVAEPAGDEEARARSERSAPDEDSLEEEDSQAESDELERDAEYESDDGVEQDEEYEREGEYEREPGPSVVDRLALGATVAGRVAGQGCRHAARSAVSGMGWLVARARSRTRSPVVRRQTKPLRRTTAPPRSIPRNAVPGYVSNSQASRREVQPAPRVRLRVPLAAAALVGTAVLSSWLTRSGSDEQSPAPALSKPAPAEPSSQTVPPAAPVPEDQAEVPLFGPAQLEASKPQPAAPAKTQRDDSASDEDLRFGQKKKAVPRKGTKVFARGRLHLPMVHKLKLDQQGQLLHGESTPTGFQVLIFDRKMMESGAAIARRDDRIAKVVTRNTPEGARVEFRFHDEIPAYKVRLKNGYVEFFINS